MPLLHGTTINANYIVITLQLARPESAKTKRKKESTQAAATDNSAAFMDFMDSLFPDFSAPGTA